MWSSPFQGKTGTWAFFACFLWTGSWGDSHGYLCACQVPLLCLLQSSGTHGSKPYWLSGLDVFPAHPLGEILKSWGTRYMVQTLCSSGRFSPDFMAFCQEWGLWWDHVSVFPMHFDVGIFSFIQHVGVPVDFSQRELLHICLVHLWELVSLCFEPDWSTMWLSLSVFDIVVLGSFVPVYWDLLNHDPAI